MAVTTAKPQQTTRVVKLVLDDAAISDQQRELLDRHAGTARLTWNWALGLRNAYEKSVTAQAQQLARSAAAKPEMSEEQIEKARKALLSQTAQRKKIYAQARIDVEAAGGGKPNDFTAFSLSKLQTSLARSGQQPWDWWATEKHGVSRYAISFALANLDTAIKRFYQLRTSGSSRTSVRRAPRKDGMPDNWPRFKAHGHSDPAFALFSIPETEDKLIRGNGSHRLKLPNLGTVRVHDSLMPLRQMMRAGGVPKSARFVQHAGTWTMAINVSFDATNPFVQPAATTARQRRNGAVGMSLGIAHAATLSNAQQFENQRVLEKFQAKRARIQQRMAILQGPDKRTKTPASKAWLAKRNELRRVEAKIAAERDRICHEMTKELSTTYSGIAAKKISIDLMNRNPQQIPDPDRPRHFLPNGASRQSELTRGVLDVAFAKIVEQLTYKTQWYGSQLDLIEPGFLIAHTCSACGAVKPAGTFPVEIRTYICEHCGTSCDRALNNARNAEFALRLAHSPAQSDGSSPWEQPRARARA